MSFNHFHSLIIFLLLFTFSVPQAQAKSKRTTRTPSADWAEAKQKKLKSLIERAGLKGEMSLYASEDGIQLIEHNASAKLIPASITKIVTAAITLKTFPPATKFTTELLSDARIEGSQMKGSLYLRGGGDPSFVSETMWFLVNNFVRTGVQEITGDVVVDDSLFDRQRYDSSRESIRVERAYDAPTGAMSFNWNSVNIFVRPGAKAGEPARVMIDPENDYIELKNSVKTTSGSTAIDVDRQEGKDGDRVVVRGSIAVGAPEQVIYNNITRPDLWSGYNLVAFLKQRGIKVNGKVKTGSAPAVATILAKAESKPIEQVLADMNKFSNNYVAEMLAKNVAAQRTKPGTIAAAIEIMHGYLYSLGLKKEEFTLVNPSGLTRENRFSAQGLWRVLRDMKDQFQYQPEFATSLPIAGIDGTLKKRMKNTAGERWVRAKTGLLNGVVALAGYAGRSDGFIFPFVFIYNGGADEAKVRQFFDRLCVEMVED